MDSIERIDDEHRLKPEETPVFVGHFSTKTFGHGEEADGWRDLLLQAGFSCSLEPPRGEFYRASGIVRALPGLAVVSGKSSSAKFIWENHNVMSGDISLCICHGEAIATRQARNDAIIHAGEAIIMSHGDAGFIDTGGDTPRYSTSLRLPTSVVAAIFPDLGAIQNLKIGAHDPVLRLLKSYVRILEDVEAMASPRQRELATQHIYDLVALAAGRRGDVSDIARRRGLQAARLHGVKQDIAKNFGDPNLRASTLAARHGITPRHVHRLFEAEGVSLSDYLLSQRLTEAHCRLSDPTANGQTISDIAFSMGFSDLSYFNRTFRRRFGATPSEVREIFSTTRSKTSRRFKDD